LKQFKSAAIRVRIEELDFPSLLVQEFDCLDTVYGNVKEEITTDTPKPLGKPVFSVSYLDANLYDDMITGGTVTVILNFCNKSLVYWFSKLQACVQTATIGSEANQIVELNSMLPYLGVPIKG
jgi:hypothetical protein